MRMRIVALLVLAVLPMAGCGTKKPPSLVIPPAPPGLSTHELKKDLFPLTAGILHLRQTAHFTFRGRTFPMLGMMSINPSEQNARLVAVNELGITLFDVEINESKAVEHFAVPQLARFPRFGEAVASSLRRIFLAPYPHPEQDSLTIEKGCYILSGKRGKARVRFFFGGPDAVLVGKEATEGRRSWQVLYRDYRSWGEWLLPHDIVLIDNAADYRLQLKILQVRGKHEELE